MNSTRPTLPPLPDNERTPFIDALLELVQWQSERIADLEDEDADNDKQHKKQRVRRKKKKALPIHEEQIIQPDALPAGSRFKAVSGCHRARSYYQTT